MAEKNKIIPLHPNQDEWLYECECGWQEFYALTTVPIEQGFTGLKCVSCGKVIEFFDEDE